MIKNILSISASNIDVEWIFNTTSDTCYYHQNCLNLDTIEMIMLVKWYEKLEVWIFEKNLDSSNKKKRRVAELNKLSINKLSITIKQEKIEWKIEIKSSDKSKLDTNEK